MYLGFRHSVSAFGISRLVWDTRGDDQTENRSLGWGKSDSLIELLLNNQLTRHDEPFAFQRYCKLMVVMVRHLSSSLLVPNNVKGMHIVIVQGIPELPREACPRALFLRKHFLKT